jgi:hypothetical protein
MKTTNDCNRQVETANTDPKAKNPGCANYDHHYGGCLFRDECLVQQGKRCRYFERVVLQDQTIYSE